MLPRNLRLVLVIGLAILSASCLVSAETPSWSITGPAFSASIADLQAAAAKVPAEPFMEVTVLFERDHYSFDTSGRMTYRHTMIFRVETSQGVQDWAELRVHWSPWHQNTPEIRARVISPEGKVTQLDPKTITDGPAREDSEDTYTDDRIHKVPLPAIAVGVIVEEETVTSDTQPFFAGGGAYDDSFSRQVPIIRSELLIDVPAAINFRFKLNRLPQAQVKNEVTGDIRHFSLEQEYLPAQVDSDIDLSSHFFQGPLVRFSTGESWSSVAAAYRTLAEQNIDPAKVKSLLPKPGSDRMETIAGIVAELHKQVRYTGVEFGEASLQPAPAPDVLKRHYGDCKDKAALLVAMLRAAGVDAQMALLDSGPGVDLDPDLPGMNQFDHAIVYVPAAQGANPLWIDATAEFTSVGSLPRMDEGRNALIIAEDTTSLTLTPTPKPEADRLLELRDVVLAPFGPAHITETSMTWGGVDANYRDSYGGELTREDRENLEKYAKDAYLAKSLANITHGDSHDLATPFALKLEMTSAKRGDTGIDDALVGVPFADIFARLPEWFRTDPKTEGEKLTPEQEDINKRAVAARAPEYDVHPFTTEWRYTISPPDGFTARALPSDKTTSMGPATFTQHYETDASGKIVATYHFETAKPRYTTDEALALREAVLATYKMDIISIWFDQTGAKLIATGKTREALAADRKLIAVHPAESIHHVQMAYALLKAGLGAKARAEAQQATRLDPNSAEAFRALGWICQFDQIGVQFGPGMDWDCAANAYKKALQLEPDDSDSAIDLALLDEYDGKGERYANGAHFNDAIALLRGLKEKDKETAEKYENNLLFDLYYSGQYKELLAELDKVQSDTTRRGLAISAVVAIDGGTKGVAAGLARADRLSSNAQDRSAALATSGNQLMRLRLYAEAADILAAALEGQQNSAGVEQQISVLRSMKVWKNEYLPDSDPRSVVQRIMVGYFAGTLDEAAMNRLLARHAYASDQEWRRNLKQVDQSRGALRVGAAQDNLPQAVLLDLLATSLKLSSEGEDDTGYRITMQSLGAKPRQLFVTRESDGFRVVTDGDKPQEAGNQVLYLLANHRDKEAQSLLDWMRGKISRGGGDDPLLGPIFPRFWTAGDAPDHAAMRLAGLSLIASTPAIKESLPELAAAWQKAPAGDARLNLELLLANGYRSTQDGAHLKEIAAEILKSFPDSNTAIDFAGAADYLLGNWDDWKQMLDSRLAKHPDDENLIRMESRYFDARGDWSSSRATLQKLFDNGKAAASDYNMYAWTSLFDNTVNDDALKAARQATMLTNNRTFPEVHTLACLYAAHGETSEARDLLLKAMAIDEADEPNSEVWFGFGSLYQQLGVNDAAIAAFEKVEKPEGRVDPSSTYALAQTQLRALKALPQ